MRICSPRIPAEIGNHIKQFDRLVHVNRKLPFGGERSDSSANVAGERVQFFDGDKLNLSFCGSCGQSLQVEFLIAGDHRHRDAIAVTPRDQSLEDLFGRQAYFGRHVSAARSSGSTSYSRSS